MTASVSRIYLLRHGACEGGHIFRGSTDSALTAAGAAQLDRQLGRLPTLDRVISSPLQRAAQSARRHCETHQLPLCLEPAFAEIHFGLWEGRPVAEVQADAPEAVQAFWRDPLRHPPPAGEGLRDFQARVAAGWRHWLAAGRGQRQLIISHGGVIRMILAELLAMPLRPLSHIAVPHGCLSRIDVHHAEGQPDWPQLVFHGLIEPDCPDHV